MPEGNTSVRLLVLLALLAPRSAAGAGTSPGGVPGSEAVSEVRIDLGREPPRAGETREVTVSLLDVRGEPADGEVSLDSDFGVLGDVSRVGKGRYSATLTAPRVLPSWRSLLLVARGGGASSERTVPLAPGPPASIEVSGPELVRADGGSSVALELTIHDAFGNASSAEPRVRSTLGKVDQVEATGAGRWTVRYVPGHLPEDREELELLTIEADELRTIHALLLTPLDTWFAFSPWSGAVLEEGGATGLAVGAAVAHWWRADPGALGILLDVAWWRLDETTTVSLPGGVADLAGRTSYLPLTAAVAWGHRLGGRAEGWIAVGGGAVRVSTSQELADQPAVSEAGWGAGATAAVVLGLHAWRGLPFVQARAIWIADTDLLTVTGPTRALLLVAGYQFDAR